VLLTLSARFRHFEIMFPSSILTVLVSF